MSVFKRIFPGERAAKTALLFEHRQITYAALRDETVRVSELLHGLGMKPGDRIAILLADSPEFIASFVAIISLGAIAVPINLALRRQEQLFILKDCGASTAIVEGAVANSLFEGASPLTELTNLIIVRLGAGEGTLSAAGFNVQQFERPCGIPGDGLPDSRSAAALQDDAFILYTSGSTGEPKGAVHTQSDIFYTNETYCREVLNLRESDRLFS